MERRPNNYCTICEQPLRGGDCSNCGYINDTENFQNKLTSRVESSIKRLGDAIESHGDRLEDNRTSPRLSPDSRETFMTSRSASSRGQESIFQGIVRNLEWREKNYGVRSSGSSRTVGGIETSEVRTERYDRYEILTFRIEQVDSNGNINYVPVYLKAREIEGVLADGDEVGVTGRIDETRTVIPSSIHILNTGGYIKIKYKNEADYPLEHLESSSGCLSIFIIAIPVPFLLAFLLT